MKKKTTLLFLGLTLILIPALYSGLFLGTIRDPYGETKKLPVALVAKQEDRENPIYQNFKKSNALKLIEESKEQSQKELKKGEVYGIIKFEDDFSQKMNHFTKSQQPAKIDLITSSGLSFPASKILNSIVTQFVEISNEKLSKKTIAELENQKMLVPLNISSIITLTVQDSSEVKNNAEVLAPYFFILTLFVGTIFINQVFQRFNGWEEKRFTKFYLLQFILPVCFSIIQAALLTILASFFLKFTVENWLLLFMFMSFVVLVFDSIVVAINKLFPNLGAVFILIFLMFQGSMSGGSYPLVLSDTIFQQISNFLPMTYGVMGLRKIISLGAYQLKEQLIPLFIFFAFGQLLLFISFGYHKSKNKAEVLNLK